MLSMSDLELSQLIDEEYTRRPFYGSRRMVVFLQSQGHCMNRKRVQRLWRTVKYEDVYLKGYDSMTDLTLGLTAYFDFYNSERPHQSLSNLTPNQVYTTGASGGALIVDRFTKTGQRCSAASEETSIA